jgi:hypothetical protein
VITSSDTKIGTGVKLQYVDNGRVIDEMTVVLLGDLNGDARINGTDALIVKKAVIRNYTLNEAQILACCSEGSRLPIAIDYLRLKKYLLGNYDLFKDFN